MWTGEEGDGEEGMSGEELLALCREWQSRLRLQDWDIQCRFAPYEEVDGDGVTTYQWELKRALVRIVSEPTYILGIYKSLYDPEQILVHELIHLKWAQLYHWKKEQIEFGLMETAVDHLATALVVSYRR